MKLSVVIPALDEAEGIAEAVRSARSAAGVEVIVVDGGSTDGTPRRAAEAGARVLTSVRGRARQLGVGARASRGDVVLFLHADTALPPGYENAVRQALDDPRNVGGAFRLRFDREGALLRLIEWGARLRVALLHLPYGDQALFVRREALDAIGGVPQAPIMEDLDLVAAIKTRGRLVTVPLDVVTSARRYLESGPVRTWARHALALLAWRLGMDRARVADWYDRAARP